MDFTPFLILAGIAVALPAVAQFETDTIPTSKGDLKITFIGHGTLMFTFDNKVIHVDPYGKQGSYTNLPKADLILITHDHPDHLDLAAIKAVRTPQSLLLLTAACASKAEGGKVLKNGDSELALDIKIETVPAYNLVHMRDKNQPYHPKGTGNGYVLTFGDKRVYVAGDTENTPEMKGLQNIDIAFLPMNLPYTMTPEMVADAARSFRPRILYPYHYGDTDPAKLKDLLKDVPEIEIRVRNMR
jgi:L-ascorbate metabolism protein UlaG (beta-lactamase superfamily)